MKYGCIGEHLGHSFSREIHSRLSDYEYELCEVARDALCDFAARKDFLAINVTIPYKETILPYIYELDEGARLIGAVNTVVNRGGRLYGYNTDFYGMSELIRHAGIEISQKKVAILGTGGTSKTASAVVSALGAREIVKVSRVAKEGVCDYPTLSREHSDVEVIINTTPVGMYRDFDGVPVDVREFPALCGVIDAVYNPLRTRLVSDALKLGIRAEGGLYMLVAQAVRASEIFLGRTYPAGTADRIFGEMLQDKENIVLIGMPSSGKTTVARLLEGETWREVIDTDEKIVTHTGMEIPEIFEKEGEKKFREYESEVIRAVAQDTGKIISTGGGAILDPLNVERLKRNGKIYFIDRPLSELLPTEDRPLSRTREAIEARYRERYGLYLGAADVTVKADGAPDEVAEQIKEDFFR
ncbi:MAG: shikimate dehydrogenase [Clostridia bacterium]|nr:shikimate dehydrogenase [Clostridia bacterium]